MQEKAYKLLAAQEGVSNAQAKKLIDDGLVFASGKKLAIARGLVDAKTLFKIQRREDLRLLYEDADLLAVNKPAALDSCALEKKFGARLIHRLDKTTSGVILLAKSPEFREKVLGEFKAGRVYKEYRAIACGIISDEQTIDAPIFVRKGSRAIARIDAVRGQAALSHVTPLEIRGKNTLVKVVIKTGRTHQIRVHLASISHPILGDALYGGRDERRIFLHSKKIVLFGKTYECDENFS